MTSTVWTASRAASVRGGSAQSWHGSCYIVALHRRVDANAAALRQRVACERPDDDGDPRHADDVGLEAEHEHRRQRGPDPGDARQRTAQEHERPREEDER